MDPHLQRLHDQIRCVTASLSAEELAWHPRDKWSAGEILEHLYLTYTGTIKGFLQSEPVPKPQTLKQRVGAFLVLELGYFPEGVQAPTFSRPKGASLETVVADVGSKIIEMDKIMADCEAKFGPRMMRHGIHHLKQIQRLRKLKAG